MKKLTIKRLLESSPRLYLMLLGFKRTFHWSKYWIVSPKSDITIEGFPRSGNSFAHAAFRHAQSANHRIATHVHSYAQILRSVELKRPTMVLLRHPRDACLSLVALSYEIKKIEPSATGLAEARRQLKQNLINYRIFYEKVLGVGDGLIVAEFSQVTSDFGEIIRRINLRYGTDFSLYQSSPENDARLFERGGFHLSPNETRSGIKEFLEGCFENDDIRELLKLAEASYRKVLELERRQAETYERVLSQ